MTTVKFNIDKVTTALLPNSSRVVPPTMNGVTLLSSSEPASIAAANKDEKSMGIDASLLMVRARICFLPLFRTLTICLALTALVTIAVMRRWKGETLILVRIGFLVRIGGESGWRDCEEIVVISKDRRIDIGYGK